MLLAQSSAQGIIILAIAGIPEIIYHRRLVHRHTGAPGASRQALFFTFTAPPWDLFFAVGIALAGLHAQGVLSLSGYWALVALTATPPLVPLLASRSWAERPA